MPRQWPGGADAIDFAIEQLEIAIREWRRARGLPLDSRQFPHPFTTLGRADTTKIRETE